MSYPHSTQTTRHGIWLSIDLMLAFLIIQTTLMMALSPIFIEQVYAHDRAVNSQRLSSLLSLSHRVYTSAVTSTAPASIPLDSAILSLNSSVLSPLNSSTTNSTCPTDWVGYFQPISLSPTALGLLDSYGSTLPFSVSDTPPISASPDRLCIQRMMLQSGRPSLLWVCSLEG